MDFLISALKKYYAFCLFPLRLLMRIILPSNPEKETSDSKKSCCSNDDLEVNKASNPVQEEEKTQEQVKSDVATDNHTNESTEDDDEEITLEDGFGKS